ncbi:MAG: GNAT family N-acetyltransferase [Planctomycetes bacterium]|nr:GNAT family N-acetyltransferase [Planctomycetota bacterium]
MSVAYRIRTPRLLVRCWSPADVAGLTCAIQASLDHLRRWLDWAGAEPADPQRKLKQIRRWRAGFDQGRDFAYGLFDPATEGVLGAVGLHGRIGAGAGEIGYWVHADHLRKGLATEAVAAIIRVAFEINGLDRLEIHCDPKNAPGAMIPRRLGFEHQVTVPGRVTGPDAKPRDTIIWTLKRQAFSASPAASAPVEAFDAAGGRLL